MLSKGPFNSQLFYDFIIKDLIELLFPEALHLCDIYTQESKYKAKGANCSKKECPRVFKRTSIRFSLLSSDLLARH